MYLPQPIQNPYTRYYYSMKRKSESISPNIVRSLVKHKSTGTKSKKKQLYNGNSHRWGEIIVSGLLSQLTLHVQNHIQTIARKQLITGIVNSCEQMATNLLYMMCPEIDEPDNSVVLLDKEPDRVAFDPICGFDKLVMYRNEVTKTRESSHLIDSRVRPFGVYQNGKKQQQKIVSVSKLVPLESLSLEKPADKQNDKHESFLRERIYDSLVLPMLSELQHKKAEPSKNPKAGNQSTKQPLLDQCVFDYNGQKSSLTILAKANLTAKPSTNNLLRTTYKVLETNIIEDKRKASLDKVRHSRISNFDLRRLSNMREIIRNPNIRNQLNDSEISVVFRAGNVADQGQLTKNILQASFKEREIKYKSVQRLARASRIM